jgi:hypothetical protein
MSVDEFAELQKVGLALTEAQERLYRQGRKL